MSWAAICPNKGSATAHFTKVGRSEDTHLIHLYDLHKLPKLSKAACLSRPLSKKFTMTVDYIEHGRVQCTQPDNSQVGTLRSARLELIYFKISANSTQKSLSQERSSPHWVVGSMYPVPGFRCFRTTSSLMFTPRPGSSGPWTAPFVDNGLVSAPTRSCHRGNIEGVVFHGEEVPCGCRAVGAGQTGNGCSRHVHGHRDMRS